MRTFTVDIINKDAVKLLEDLELMKLIKVRKEKKRTAGINWTVKYKGAMKKQGLLKIDAQINELRNQWQ